MAHTDTLPSNEERNLLRSSLRGLLEEHWPLDSLSAAAERSNDSQQVLQLHQHFTQLGLTSLGFTPEEGGLREALIVMEEVGRRCAPVPIIGGLLTNFLLEKSSPLLARVHQGNAIIAFHPGNLDPDISASAVDISGSSATGELNYVEDGTVATHLIFHTNDGWVCADLNNDSVNKKSLSGLSRPALTQVKFQNTPVTLIGETKLGDEELLRLFKLCLCLIEITCCKMQFPTIAMNLRRIGIILFRLL